MPHIFQCKKKKNEGGKTQEVGDIGTIYYSFAYRIISLLVTGIYYLPPEAKKRARIMKVRRRVTSTILKI